MDQRDLEPGHRLYRRLARLHELVRDAARRHSPQHHPSRTGLTTPSKAGPVWNGTVRFNEDWLTQPLQWKRPRMIFVCAHGDLFHESVPDAWIERVFVVMALAPQHTFQVMTKRSARMRAHLSNDETAGRLTRALAHGLDGIGVLTVESRADGLRGCMLPNVWLGVSVEDQRRADERVPDLLATPAAVRFVSAEPLLGPIDLMNIRRPSPLGSLSALPCEPGGTYLDWVIVGGESGAGARPTHPDWARQIRNQCAAAEVPFFFKQWGAFHPADQLKNGDQIRACGDMGTALRSGAAVDLGDQWTWRVGKKVAGRLLDGVEHNGMPEARV